MNIEFRFNRIAFQNSVAHWQERQRGDNNTIIIAALDRKTRIVTAKFGAHKGQRVQLATIRPIASAGFDRFKNRPFFTISATYQPALAADEWMPKTWLDDIERRTKGCLCGDLPYQVKRFLLEGNNAGASFGNQMAVYEYLSRLYGAISQTPGDAADKESARLAGIALAKTPALVAPGGLILGGLPAQIEMGVAA